MMAAKYPLHKAYAQETNAVAENLSVNLLTGLDDAAVHERLKEYGHNVIHHKDGVSIFTLLLSQLKSPFVIILGAAAALSSYFNEQLDAIAILIVILINTIIGFVMEYQAKQSMEALKRLTQMNTKVVRQGRMREVPSEELVPGDVLYLEAGDMVLADARIFKCAQLQADESALTGESLPIEKTDRPLDESVILAERSNMVYKGTFITKGSCNAIVTATAMHTELGGIAAMVQQEDKGATPLEKKIGQFSKRILWLMATLLAIIFVAGFLREHNFVKIFQTSVALAVAAIPEGLPIVTTLALAQGMLKMAGQKVIVKKLAAVETLGGTTIICTDKTGTLTENKIEVCVVATPGGHVAMKRDKPEHSMSKSAQGNFQRVIDVSVLCNTAELHTDGNETKEVGDPLETGLLKFARNEQVNIESHRQRFSKIAEEPFSSETRIMATAHTADGGFLITAKGATEELLNNCTGILLNDRLEVMTEQARAHWLKEAQIMAGNGMRTIAAAYRESEEMPDVLHEDLVFCGLIGMIDPPRKEVFAAIADCKSAGVNVIMITGDHPAMAKNIGLKLGLLESEKEEPIHGNEMGDFDTLSEADKEKWRHAKIFARVTPRQKLDLIAVLQEAHHVVGMTGDGINDAPALKKADIGIAMGQRGTQVAQEVAGMVIKDDSFTSIVLAIRQGRVIFENIRKFVIYLLSCNLSELCVVFVTFMMGAQFTLLPLQILYINLLTDVLPALALGVTEGGSLIMKHPPRNPNEPIIDKQHWKSLVAHSLIITACALGAVFFAGLVNTASQANAGSANNILFITMILCQLCHVFNMGQDGSVSFHKSEVFRNKYAWYAVAICMLMTAGAFIIPSVAQVLSLHKLYVKDLSIAVGFSFLSFMIIQVLKRISVIY